jgi:arsenite methyltransferase
MTIGSVTGIDPAHLKACCADLWSNPGVRLLAGESLHPGGVDLTRRALALMELPPGSLMLDAGSGPPTTRDVMAVRGLRPVGVDVSLAWHGESRSLFAGGDAERLPFADGSFAGAVAECVVSVLPDKAAAARELRRVVRPGGRVAISDVTADGPLPQELATFVGWIACAAGALPAAGYTALLEEAGLRPRAVEDRTPDLAEMIAKARRRLALLQGAAQTGLVDLAGAGIPSGLLDLGQRLLSVAAETARAGSLGYVLIVADRATVRASPRADGGRPALRPSA